MKQTFVVFCYRGEEEILPITVSRVRTVMPFASVHLFDDSNDPLPERAVEKLTEMAGVYYEKTTFDRQVNLNGTECIRGELHCMQRAADKDNNKDGVIIKMDPDTLILRSEAILQLLANDHKFITGTSVKGIFSGMFYAMRRDILDTVTRNADLITFPENAAEDESIGSLAYIAAARSKYTWFNAHLQEMRKFFAAFDVLKIGTPQYQEDIEYVARYGHIITTGNTGIAQMPSSYRVTVAKDLLAALNRQTMESNAQTVNNAVAHQQQASQSQQHQPTQMDPPRKVDVDVV